MSRSEIIEKTVNALNELPEGKAEEVAEFAEFVLHKAKENDLQKDIQYLVQNSSSFNFLREEEDIYTVNDLKERYK